MCVCVCVCVNPQKTLQHKIQCVFIPDSTVQFIPGEFRNIYNFTKDCFTIEIT